MDRLDLDRRSLLLGFAFPQPHMNKDMMFCDAY